MDAEHVNQFEGALIRGDDSLALSMLQHGRVTVASLWRCEADGDLTGVFPVLFAAIQHEREGVVRALVHRGADLDDFHLHACGEYAVTAVGFAITNDSVSMLRVCHRLGAKFSKVFRGPAPMLLPGSDSGLMMAVASVKPACLAYLLDEVDPVRPVVLSRQTKTTLALMAARGGIMKAVFEVLQSSGFNFRLLEKVLCAPDDEVRADEPSDSADDGPSGAQVSSLSVASDGTPYRKTLADVMLTNALQSGDAVFLRYLVNDLGLVSTTGQMEFTKDFVDPELTSPSRQALLHDVAHEQDNNSSTSAQGPGAAAVSTEYACAVCEAVRAAKICGSCKVTRYCSSECQGKHWRNGGHKEECKFIQRRAKESLSAVAGSADGSRQP